MEARGIEPRSEPRSKAASTCVGCALGLRRLAHNRPYRRTIFLQLKQRAEATRSSSLTLRYPRAASGGLPRGQEREAEAYAREAEAYAASAISGLAVLSFPVFLPGHREPGHAATPSQGPSKPVAPISLKCFKLSSNPLSVNVLPTRPRSDPVQHAWPGTWPHRQPPPDWRPRRWSPGGRQYRSNR